MDIALPHEGVAGRFEGGEAGNWDLAKKLKPLMTEPTVSVNIKYGPQKGFRTSLDSSCSRTIQRRF
jgi:hypothetical protein